MRGIWGMEALAVSHEASAIEAAATESLSAHDPNALTCGCAACAMPPNVQSPPGQELLAAPAATPDVPISTALLAEVSYLTGVASNGTLTSASYWGFNGATARKWMENAPASTTSGPAGVGGGTVKYFFDAASNWSATEKDAFTGGLKLWSAVANLQFELAASSATADCLIIRGTGSDGAYCSTPTYGGSGSSLGRIAGDVAGVAYQSKIVINTSQSSWTNLDSFDVKGGYGVATIVHEAGHLIGLGHGGPYNGSANPSTDQQSAFDSRLWTTMSYIRPYDTTAKYFSSYPVTGTQWGSTADGWQRSSAYTWMPLDILAAQQIYGAATVTPLAGGVVFGFNCNIPVSSGIRSFFDFTIDTRPVVTLYSSGANNTLDLSGYSTRSVVDLRAGHFTSAAGLVNNIAIAYGTVIETAIGGSGADEILGNDAANTLSGGYGADVIYGGLGADVLYGNQDSDVLYGGQDNDVAYGGQGDDVLYGDEGADALFGNLADDALYGGLGDDLLNGGAGANRLDGGGGTDTATYADAAAGVTVSLMLQGSTQATGVSSDILVAVENLVGSAFGDTLAGDGAGNILSGGYGADVLSGGYGTDVLYGNQDNDVLYGNQDGDVLYGGQGNDVLFGGQGDDVLVGGAGADIMQGNLGADRFLYLTVNDSPVSAFDQITEFTTGQDKIDLRPIHTGGANDSFTLTTSGGFTTLNVDLGNNGTVDLRVVITGVVANGDILWG